MPILPTDNDKLGINLRSLLDGELALFKGDFSDYKQRNGFITKIEKRIAECDFMTLSAGTTLERTSLYKLDLS